MKPKVSIIVPVYNVEKYLERCMDSLLNQTLKEIEIILVDDGSPDNCPIMCDKYATMDNRVRVVHKTNAGLGFARNTGLSIASGDYIAFVDSDDFVSLDMYDVLYSKASDNHLDILFCGFYEYQSYMSKNLRSEVSIYEEYTGTQCQEVLHGMLSPCGVKGRITRFEMSVWHSIYKKTIFDSFNVQFCSEREFISEDIIFHIDFIRYCNKIGFVPNPFYYYCLNENSLSKSYNPNRFKKVDVLCEQIWNRVIKYNYSFPVEDCMFFICLSLRYPITILKQYDFSLAQKKKIVREIICSDIMTKWIQRINWGVLPLRYFIFFQLVKFKMTNLLLFTIR